MLLEEKKDSQDIRDSSYVPYEEREYTLKPKPFDPPENSWKSPDCILSPFKELTERSCLKLEQKPFVICWS